MPVPDYVRRFRFIGILTVVAVYILILVGGIVRSTGSGMGCPDWPKCFGTWVPPTHISQLPVNYKEIYTTQRVEKNKKLAAKLERMGFHQVAGDIFAHPTQYIETDFNPVKTWIEYVNRLIGALIGVFVFLTVVFALPYWKRDKPVFWLAFASFILTGVQGWLGSLVVSTNLLPIMVTIHMGLALLIVAMLIYAVDRSQGAPAGQQPIRAIAGLTTWLWIGIILTFGQIVLGTQVREQIDMVAFANNYLNRAEWIEQLGGSFRFHRTFSAVLLLVNVYLAYRLYLLPAVRLHKMATAILVCVGGEILAGVLLAYFAFPAVVQPVHLTLATLLFGAQFLALIAYRRVTKLQPQTAIPAVVA
ncbi:cytochrome c oxidase assembly protein subunit 15 [Hymenobacter gelipurpurascens]|uniref:Cytochrome c oxidase assembly protein subunit 15 n=1 Tax=Hymenobacter gelipurpurascens TaxID=89968 RepID=A0A212U967_9BACT|nr:COX15/CtaA family protein [Hymenobacter gelipurpurascens]SNC74812.1 cytochrome c oxidase assembly protein subunit 15 [Hymenobacter gelipurpurascens]